MRTEATAQAPLDRTGVKRVRALKRRLWWRQLWHRIRPRPNRGYRPDPRAFRDPDSGEEITLDLNQPCPGTITDLDGSQITGQITMRDLLWMAERPDGSNPMLTSIFAQARAAQAAHRAPRSPDVGYVSLDSFTGKTTAPDGGSSFSCVARVEWNPAVHDMGEWKAFTSPTGDMLHVNLLQVVRGSIDGEPVAPILLGRLLDMVGEAGFIAAIFSQLGPTTDA